MVSLTPNITSVPSSFDVKLPGINGPRGTAFYRAKFESKQGKDIQVYIAACAFYCQLYFDGKYVGDHKAGGTLCSYFLHYPSRFQTGWLYSGYQPFWFHITQNMMNASTSTHEIFIVSDNRYNHYSAPTYTGGDFYHFGGLNRNVLVHTLNLPNTVNNSLIRVEVFPIDYIKGTIDLNITFTYKFHSDETKYFKLTFDGDNKNFFNMSSAVKQGESSAILTNVGVPNVKLWSLDTPNLHTLLVEYVDSEYGNTYDSIEIRFGLRVLGIDPNSTRITLNGEIVKFR